MAITYQISVRFRTEGECRYRKEQATIPRIPEWSRYCEGGRTFCKYYDNKPAELPHKKRWFLPDLYYKAYHVEYWTSHRVSAEDFQLPPTDEYLEWITSIIKPLPNEVLIEKRVFWEHEETYNLHVMFYHYRFIETNGVIKPLLEKSEEEYPHK